MALDFGERRIGVAISDPTRTLAQPLETITRPKGDRSLGLERIAELVESQDVDCIVIGLPLNLDGSSGPQVERVRGFGARVGERTGLKVEYLDERWTSVEAERMLRDAGLSEKKRRGRVDPIAAAILLRAWLQRASTCG